jgi:hypothetical protein
MNINELRRQRSAALEALPSLWKDKAAYSLKEREIDRLETQIRGLEGERERAAGAARPPGGQADPNKFANFGEQLLSIARHYQGQKTDQRLTRAASGMSETDPAGGGFPVQIDFADQIFRRIYDMGEIASRVFRLGISANANGIKIPGIDETSRANGSRWGGVQSYWLGEGDPIGASRPKFRLIELDLRKLGCLWYVTDELMQDAPALNGIANEAFTQELTFALEDSFVRGTGAGQPLGYLNAAAKVTVAKETGQAAGTLLYPNILKMWQSMWARSRLNAIWTINQDVEPQLYALNQVIGTAGVPVYLPPGGISERPYATLFGRPVIPVEYNPTVGTEGDISLLDMSQYVVADKNSMQQATSMHVRFVNDEMTFRILYRVDGQPLWHSALTPYQGSTARSPFVTLATRA